MVLREFLNYELSKERPISAPSFVNVLRMNLESPNAMWMSYEGPQDVHRTLGHPKDMPKQNIHKTKSATRAVRSTILRQTLRMPMAVYVSKNL